jgi:cytochrome P450
VTDVADFIETLGELDRALVAALMTPEGRADPYPHYATLREATPVHVSAIGPVVVARYDDCVPLLRDPRLGAQPEPTGVPLHELFGMTETDFTARFPRFDELPNSLLGLNPPDHTRVRSLVTKAFTPSTIERLRPHIVDIADDLLDQIDGTVDVMEALALSLPMTVIGELLGVPRPMLEEIRPHVRVAIDLDVRRPSLERFTEAYDAGDIVATAFGTLMAERRTSPGDDLLSHLLHIEEEGDRLTEPELLALVMLLFGAGFETTTNLIGNGLRALLLHPDQLDRLRADRSLMKTAVEEMLRWDSPVQMTGRSALEDVEVLGVTLPRGAQLMLLQGAACRDPRKYDDPDRFDVGRVGAPTPMVFGGGIHYCLGAALARAEGQVVFDRLLDRFATIEPGWTEGEPPQYRDSTILRGLEALPVSFA